MGLTIVNTRTMKGILNYTTKYVRADAGTGPPTVVEPHIKVIIPPIVVGIFWDFGWC